MSAAMTTITVTADDIAAARAARYPEWDYAGRRDCPIGQRRYSAERDCPIAQALRRQYGADRDLVRAHPGYDGVTVTAGSFGPYTLDVDAMPGSALARYMQKWDRCRTVQPHTFRIHNRAA